MTDSILGLLNELGLWGLLLSMFIEGSAFPFIGTVFIVTGGFLLELTWFQIIWTSIFGSLLYALGSLITYIIGCKLGDSVENRLSLPKRESFEKAKVKFNKYGVWYVAIFSPLHLGNVSSN